MLGSLLLRPHLVQLLGVGVTNNKAHTVRIGNITKFSGQGGRGNKGEICTQDVRTQIVKAFQDVGTNMRGWEDVFSVRSYHISLALSFNIMEVQFRKVMPSHQSGDGG